MTLIRQLETDRSNLPSGSSPSHQAHANLRLGRLGRTLCLFLRSSFALRSFLFGNLLFSRLLFSSLLLSSFLLSYLLGCLLSNLLFSCLALGWLLFCNY